ncbi:Na+/H+ antiporter subunit E [Caloramator sp. mosi_1]|uniref:Na+/H+ antiporter subunit E n=1 Tax=Caloramator sp. mosi_1 TaxID=3023090 RepID=UPI00235F2E79|nr:Na+/H+ antiporter subunit E [Caloramator sp. mosi_1]WDC83837.1 Na+/H+ antiporter subunit E [Caloramator sp. mosi_1]
MKPTKLSSVLSTFIFCYLFWILFTWTFTSQELIAGAVVSLLVAVLTARFFIHENAFYLFNPVKFINLVLYIFIFLKELWKANVDVARRSLNPNLPVNPGIVKVPVSLESEYGMSMLANSITLTPGTITMDITEENGKHYYYIHWIDVSEKDREKAGEAIKGTLESWIRRIWK